jgi:hypothetical protein
VSHSHPVCAVKCERRRSREGKEKKKEEKKKRRKGKAGMTKQYERKSLVILKKKIKEKGDVPHV